MNEIPSHVARRQTEICLALVQEIDQAVVNGRQPADQYLAHFYRQHREYGARDRRFLSNAVFSWFRWRGWLKTPTNVNIAAAILLDADEILPQIEYMYSNFKAGDPPVGYRSEDGHAQARPLHSMFTNTDSARADLKLLGRLNLADKASGLQELLKGDRPRVEQLAPDWVSDSLFIPTDRQPEAHLRQCLETFQARPPTWLRLRADQMKAMTHLLTQMGIEIGIHPCIKQAVFIKGSKNCDLARLPGAEAQDLASQCVGICCSPKPGEKWWDVCAGAGGKSLHLADLTRDNGFILATDVRPVILEELSKRLKRNSYRSIKISPWDGLADLAPEIYFDGVLVDAPCSGLGTWHRNPDARWRISDRQIGENAGIQKNLLQIAAKKVKPGGRLVYSTCTLTRAENTDMIARFLEEHHEFQLEKLINPLNREPAGGIIWIWPWEGNCNGMFIAVMRKDQGQIS